MSVLGDIREGIRVRLVTAASPHGVRLFHWDAMGQDLGANALVVGVPSTSLGKGGDPYGADDEVGRWSWQHRWPITLYVARTPDAASTVLLDTLQQHVVEALMSDLTLGGSCVASALDSSDPDDSDPDLLDRYHVIRWELVTATHTNL